jgi:hypothetical protein
MKVTCSNCQNAFHAPDEWVGRKVRCPKCKQPTSLPTKEDADLSVDLGSLGAIEAGGQALVVERKGKPMTLKEAQAAAAAGGPKVKPAIADPTIRTCPQCGQKVRVIDLYSEVLCRHCGGGISAVAKEDDGELVGFKVAAEGLAGRVSFYAGFTSAAFYPIPAIAFILTAMAIALGVIAAPTFGLLGLLNAASLNSATKQDPTSLAWVGTFLTAMFVLEGVYFGSIAYYCMIDTIRSTTAGNEQPPGLTWNVTKIGSALGGYAALIGFYLAVVLILVAVFGNGFPTAAKDFAVLGNPISLTVLALMTFSIPMNIIGLASSEMVDGLNPAKVAMSIGRLLGHYIFMFLIVLIYMGFYLGLMYAVMSWAGPVITEAAAKGISVGYLNVLGAIAGWAALMGLGFYFAYMIGRILGLFARTYKEQMEFGL